MASEHRSIEYRLHENLVTLQGAVKMLEFDEKLVELLDETKDLIKSKRYSVAVMGEFKRGKSSLINALLGSKILPADATPTTATVNRITYGSEPRTVINYKDGHSEEIAIDELTEYVTKLTPDGESRAAGVAEAVVYYPTVICQNNVDIIDTPGLNDEARMTAITIDMVKFVDAIIVPIHARSPFSESEMRFVCQLIESDSISNIFFVVTFMDQLDPDDYIYEKFIEYLKNRIQTEIYQELEKRGSPDNIIEKAHRILDDVGIIGISCSQALESFINNNRKLRKESRFEEFQAHLFYSVTSQQVENAVRKTQDCIEYVVTQFKTQNEKRIALFENEKSCINKANTLINEMRQKTKLLLDSIIADDYDNLNEITFKLNKGKNHIAGIFISRLALVRSDTHECISEALVNAMKTALDYVEQQVDETKNEIINRYMNNIEHYLLKCDELLKETISFLGISADAQPLEKNMTNKVKNIFSELCFKWSYTPIPPIDDLTQCNPIDTIVPATDASIAACIADIEQARTDIRREWFALSSDYFEKLYKICRNLLNQKNEANDIKRKTYENNYIQLSENAKVILQKSRE